LAWAIGCCAAAPLAEDQPHCSTMLRILGRDRVQWLAVVAFVAVCNAVSFQILGSITRLGAGAALLNTFGVNPIFWFALLIATAIAFESDVAAPLRRGDGPITAAVVVLALLPINWAASAGVVLAACWLLVTAPRASRERRVVAILLALTTSLIWGNIVLILFGDWLVWLDARFVGWLAGTRSQGNLVDFTLGGNPFAVAYGCSSMHNITMAIQLWVAMTQLLRIPIGLRVILVGLAAIVANVLVNGLRLATIARNREMFDYWHEGAGGLMFAWLAVFVVAMIIMIGCNALAPRRV
jgi:exosortase/archaeosortase family protein